MTTEKKPKNFWFEKDGEFISIRANNKKEAQALFNSGNYTDSSLEDREENNSPQYKLLFGFEIETEYNSRKLGDIHLSSYHSSDSYIFTPGWFSESDGSLRTMDFIDGRTAEFISLPVPIDKVEEILNNFKNGFISRASRKGFENQELKDLLSFNESTGAHVHFSLVVDNGMKKSIFFKNKKVEIPGYQERNIKSFVSVDFLHKFTKKLSKRIKEELPEFYENFKKYYFRSYAKRMRSNASQTRYLEFNLNTSFPTIEFRSSHLRGITTWKQLFKYYKILTESAQETFNKEFQNPEPFSENTVLSVEIDDELEREETEELIIRAQEE